MIDELKNNVICGCSGTTVGQILSLISEGVVDMDRISRITGAASGCGGCEFDLQDMLEKHVTQEAES
ncbi:MAG: (2Fe-2S)-binding protein [Methylomonas lenta]|jgi:bacterioferritin-associated ferredoxin|nr:(2Fe-2S)-binding protein [Methylomonas lenta]